MVIKRTARDFKTGKLLSDAESGSEWETEDEGLKNETAAGLQGSSEEIFGEESIEVEVSKGPISYSSILKNVQRPKSTTITATMKKAKVELDTTTASSTVGEVSNKVLEQAVPKKVKKKDPIIFDFSSALKAVSVSQVTYCWIGLDLFCILFSQKLTSGASKKKQQKPTILGSKITPFQRPSSSNVVSVNPNKLDSTAPSKRRGKERESPKKKRNTTVKKLIIAARARRKLELERQRASPETVQGPDELPEEEKEEDSKSRTEKASEPTEDVIEEEEEKVNDVQDEENCPPLQDENSPEFKAKKEMHSKRFRE